MKPCNCACKKQSHAELCANELSKISCLKYFTVSFDFASKNCVRTVDKVRGTNQRKRFYICIELKKVRFLLEDC